MAARTYENFDLLVESMDAGVYRARVTACPSGDARAQVFRLPFTEEQLRSLLDAINPARPRTRRIFNPHQQACADLGGGLFDALFRDDIRTAWSRSLDETRDRHAGLRLRLRLGDAPELAGLPWEFLYDTSGQRYVAQSDRTPVVRYLDVSEPPRPLLVRGPLRILVVICGPIGLPALDTEAEWARIAEVLDDRVRVGSVILDRLPQPTLGALQSWLRRNEVHVLHFVGHGEYDRRSEEGYLAFCDAAGRVAQVNAATLGAHVRDHDPLRLVVLNACQTATTDSVDVYSGVAQGLVQQEAAAVVAMQYPITDGAAIAFTGGFYGALTDGEPVDQAITSVRKTLLEDHPEEWATPVLFLRAADGRVFDMIEAPPGAAGARLVDGPPAIPPAPRGARGNAAGWPGRRRMAGAAAGAVAVVAATAIILGTALHGSGGDHGTASKHTVGTVTTTSTSTSSAVERSSLSAHSGSSRTSGVGHVGTVVRDVPPPPDPSALPVTGSSVQTYTGPSDSAYRRVAQLRPGNTVSARCTAYGAAGAGGSRLWYWTSDHGWINDHYVDSGGTEPVRPRCEGDLENPAVGSSQPAADHGPFAVVLGNLPSAPVRDTPALSGATVDSVVADALVIVDCSVTGTDTVTAYPGGTTSAIWDRLTDGDWIPDAYLLTGVTTGAAAPACAPLPTSSPTS